MIALILTLIITIASVAHFYLKFAPLKSFIPFLSAIIALVVAFSYYELVAGWLVSKGFIPQVAHSLCYLLIFAICSLGLNFLLGFVVGSNVDFGPLTKNICAVVFGILTGLIVSGVVVVSLSLAPLRKSIPYARFDETINVSDPSSSIIPVDSFVVGIYNMISKGALGGGNRFDVVHANFLDQIHLNRYAVKAGVGIVAGEGAAFVEKFGVRKKELPGGDVRTVVELHIKNKKIKKGGAMGSDNKVTFALAQARLICDIDGKRELTGKNVKVFYPERYLLKGQPAKNDVKLSEVISFAGESFVKTSGGKAARIDLAFRVPVGLTPRLLQFKANNVITLPKIATQEEIDAAAAEADANKPADEEAAEPAANDLDSF
jgi:hypothetical protein